MNSSLPRHLAGVLYSGDEPIPAALEALRLLRDLGKKIVFVTNNACESKEEVTSKLAKFGYQVDKSHIVTSASAAADYLATFHPGVTKASPHAPRFPLSSPR
jgi:4-nitrophenyl phosphatase